MVEQLAGLVEGWDFDRVSIGVPAPVADGRVLKEPVNLGKGWKGFDFEAAFGKPTKVVNDAVMQAIGSYEGGRMLYLGLGTGLGSTMILEGTIQPMELGHLPYRRATFEDVRRPRRPACGSARSAGARRCSRPSQHLSAALQPDYVMLGGGLANELGTLPENVRLGGNEHAFEGGFKLWE